MTIARPSADLVTGWTPSTGTALYSLVDETVADDSDYISATEPATCDLALSAVTDPGTSSGQVLTIRAKSDTGNTLIATLKQDTAVIPAVSGGSASLILPRKTYNQPQRRVELLPEYKNAEICIVGGLKNLGKTGGYLTRGITRGTIGSSVNPIGMAYGPTSSDGGYIAFDNTPEIKERIHSGIIVGVVPTLMNNCTLLCTSYSLTNGGFRIGLTATGSVYLVRNDIVVLLETPAGRVASNVPFKIAYSYNGYTGKAIIAVNGMLTTGSLIADVSTSSSITSIGSYYSITNADPGAKHFNLVAHWASEKSQKEVINLSNYPWQLFKQQPSRIPFTTPDIPASGGTTTIATRTITGLTSSYEDYPITLTSGECDAITDYSTLHVELEADV